MPNFPFSPRMGGVLVLLVGLLALSGASGSPLASSPAHWSITSSCSSSNLGYENASWHWLHNGTVLSASGTGRLNCSNPHNGTAPRPAHATGIWVYFKWCKSLLSCTHSTGKQHFKAGGHFSLTLSPPGGTFSIRG
jgi:hypothetical protein